MQTIYDVDYFIQKFSAIPDNRWWAGGTYFGKVVKPALRIRAKQFIKRLLSISLALLMMAGGVNF